MAPASTTPNFSRPFNSPLSTGALETPVRSSRRRHALSDLPQSASQANMPLRRSAKAPSPAKKPFDVASHSTVKDKPAECQTDDVHDGGGVPSVPGGRHNRKLSDVSQKSTTSDSAVTTVLSAELGDVGHPIKNFRPYLWRHLDVNRETLNIDVFWPIKLEDIDDEEEEDENGDLKGVFPIKELQPLKTFHNLHYLQLNGMMRSYQSVIWATCWVNKNLTKVHLEMALEPLICDDIMHKYRKIDTKWTFDRLSDTAPENEYMGSHGSGTLHEEFGDGEYLDQQVMKNSQLDVLHQVPVENLRYLPITHLTLMNFVVDGGPFYRWFDPAKFKEITFKGDCIDSGFSLPDDMMTTVRVNSPKPVAPARWVRPGEVKLVEIKKKKPTTDKAEASGKAEDKVTSGKAEESGKAEASGNGGGLKSKLSQIMPKWGSKGKDETAQLEKNMAKMGM
ncbi:hypothetical protein PV11_09674 [Exophiala sideris]|uniref:Uncharacterized protein n=1 Tax=Exophiala sideris TaxID=1016849 RepID=A0A0D1YSJ2_9EURO|nr:hypothetical protein PV11_09674 [Exophiala sideris]